MRLTATRQQLDAVLDGLARLAGEAFSAADRIQAAVGAQLGDGLRPTRDDLALVEPVATEVLTAAESNIEGVGFVVAAGLMPEARLWLEWFVRDRHGRASRLEVHPDPLDTGLQDYEQLPWYAVPRTSRARHVTGPYLDSLCSEDYMLTFTQPMTVNGTFLGVSGADITVRAAERTLLPILRSIASPVAVVNSQGRTLISNTGALLCGELVGRPVDELSAFSLPGIPLHVVALDERR